MVGVLDGTVLFLSSIAMVVVSDSQLEPHLRII